MTNYIYVARYNQTKHIIEKFTLVIYKRAKYHTYVCVAIYLIKCRTRSDAEAVYEIMSYFD